MSFSPVHAVSQNADLFASATDCTLPNVQQLEASLFMVALCNRETIYIFILFLSSFFFLFFSSPNLSSRRLDVYHTLAHGVALVRI